MLNVTSIGQPAPERYPLVVSVDGSLRCPMHNDTYLAVAQIAFASVGIPLNSFMAFVILRLKRLRSKPRNIFLLGIIISNLSTFLPASFELTNFYYPGNKVVCQSFVASIGIPQNFVLLSTFLSLVDRYVAIRHPLWHRLRVTVRRVAIGLIFCSIVTVLVSKYVFIFGVVPVTCGIRLIERFILGWMLHVLFYMCVTARITVYIQTRGILRRKTIEPSGMGRRKSRRSCCYQMSLCQTDERADNHDVTEGNHGPRRRPSDPALRRAMSQRTVSRLDMDVTRTLAAGVTSLIFLSLPLMIFAPAMAYCRARYPPAYCSRFSWLAAYFEQFGMIHALYHPISYLAWNPEFAGLSSYL